MNDGTQVPNFCEKNTQFLSFILLNKKWLYESIGLQKLWGLLTITSRTFDKFM